MNRRGLFGVLAFVLALAGAVGIFFYVRGADARALAEQQPTAVLVVTRDVPAGTRAVDLTPYVSTQNLPKVAVVDGAVAKVEQLPGDNVASTALRVGEQVLAARFVAPGSNEVAAPVPVPEGTQLVSVQLAPERVVGTRLAAGDKVGIFLTMTMKLDAQGNVTDNKDAVEQPVTKQIANGVLVARVQGATAPTTTDATPAPTAGEKLPGSEVLVTFAVDTALAERIVFAQESGSLWLSIQTPTTDTSGSRLTRAGNVLA